MQNQSLNGRNLYLHCWTKSFSTIIFRYCMLNNFAVARGQEIHGGLSSTSRFEHPRNSFSLFFLIYTMIDRSNAPFLWSLLMTDCSKHRYFNFIFLHCFSSSFLSLQNKIQFLLDRKSIRNFTTIIKTQKPLWKGNRSLNKARSGSILRYTNQSH